MIPPCKLSTSQPSRVVKVFAAKPERRPAVQAQTRVFPSAAAALASRSSARHCSEPSPTKAREEPRVSAPAMETEEGTSLERRMSSRIERGRIKEKEKERVEERGREETTYSLAPGNRETSCSAVVRVSMTNSLPSACSLTASLAESCAAPVLSS